MILGGIELSSAASKAMVEFTIGAPACPHRLVAHRDVNPMYIDVETLQLVRLLETVKYDSVSNESYHTRQTRIRQ